jgi:hypothetical protein
MSERRENLGKRYDYKTIGEIAINANMCHSKRHSFLKNHEMQINANVRNVFWL